MGKSGHLILFEVWKIPLDGFQEMKIVISRIQVEYEKDLKYHQGERTKDDF